MKRISLAALLSLCCIAAEGQNIPDNSTAGYTSAGATKPLPFNSSPNSTPTLFNYSRTFVPLAPTTDTTVSNLSSLLNVRISTTYANGWGAALQSIQKNVVLSKDLVTISDHRLSTTSLGFLPYSTQGGAKFQLSPYSDQQNYYSTLFPAEDDNAYTRSEVSSSLGTGTVVSTYGAGEGLTGHSRGTTVSSVVYTTSHDIRVWTQDENGDLVSNGIYANEQLVGTKMVGQHNSLTIEWKNKAGQVVCKQVGLNGSYLTTYYVYNDLGGLAYIVPPKATELLYANSWAITNAIRDSLCYSYKYDRYGQVTQKWTPGRGLDEIVYDRKHRPVYSRNPLQAQQGKWSFTVYDRMGRVRFNGSWSSSSQRDALQATMDNVSSPTSNTGSVEYWTYNECQEAPYPSSLTNCDINQYNYYDDYDFESGSPLVGRSFDNSFSADYQSGAIYSSMTPAGMVNGMLTGTKTRVVNPSSGMNSWLYGVVFYDAKGRVLQSQSTNPWTSGSWDISTNQYNFSGSLCQNILQHYGRSGSPKPSTKLVTRYYFHAVTGKLTNVKVKADGGIFETLSTYQYDDLGRVSQKVLGGGAEVQNLAYNIRGQVTGVNADHADGQDFPEQHFGYKLSYEYGHSVPRYDGSIAGFQWRGSSNPQSYGYHFDEAGRMTAADFTEWSNPNYSGYTWNTQKLDYSVSQLAYDENGNMLSMKQRGVGLSGGVIQPVDMDRLQYGYPTGSNRLAAVNDTVSIDYQLHDFINGNPSGRDYGYDANGNLSADRNKGITDISYNELDLPVSVTTTSNGSIANVYDAAGTLLEKTITFPSGSVPATNPWVYRYVGAFVYRNDSLLYYNHEEGRSRYLYDSAKFKNDFFIKDHLGNVRMTIVSDVSAQGTDYLATHEVAAASTENLIFENIDKIRDNSQWAPGPSSGSSARLYGGVDSTRIGTAILLNVMAGDNFELAAHAYYNAADDNIDPQYADNYAMVESLLTALSGGPGGPGGPEGPGGPPGSDYGSLQMLLNGSNYDAFDANKQLTTDASYPKAFINYMLFDEQMQLVPAQSGAVQVTSASSDNWSVINTDGSINVNQNGYLLVYLSNEQNRDVYFDDLHVLHKKGRLLEENHYYPHGLTIRAGAANPVPTRQGYQGKELQDEAGLELYDFHARQYDPQIGRFWGVDPADQFPSGYTGMGNNPANMIDPTGMVAFGMGGSSTGASNDAGNAKSREWGAMQDSWNFFDEHVMDYEPGGSGNTSGQGDEDVPTHVYNAATGNYVGTINNNSNVATIVNLSNISEAEATACINELNTWSPALRAHYGRLLEENNVSFDVGALRQFYNKYGNTKAAVISGFTRDGHAVQTKHMSDVTLDGKPYSLRGEMNTKLAKQGGVYKPVGSPYSSENGPDATFSTSPLLSDKTRAPWPISAHTHQVDNDGFLSFTETAPGRPVQGWGGWMRTLPSPADKIHVSTPGVWNVVVCPTRMYIYSESRTIRIFR